tara:strand:- start:311 stop:1009 length:699 start_codon:yes stop_codon:yes gene_type:complete
MDTISDYYESLSKVKILTKKEEKIMYEKYLKGDSSAGDKLIESCLRLCFSIAKSYWKDNNQETLKDLISSGNEGLMKALRKFDPSRDVKFSTYAAYWILMYIRKYVVEDNKIVKPPIAVRRKAKLKQASASGNTNIIYKEAKDYNCVCTAPTPEEAVEAADTLANQTFLIESLLRFLSNRERMVVAASFGLNKAPQSLCRIGEDLNLSSERIRQIRESAVSKLSYWKNYFGN